MTEDTQRQILEDLVLKLFISRDKAEFEMEISKGSKRYYNLNYIHKKEIFKVYDNIYTLIKATYDKFLKKLK